MDWLAQLLPDWVTGIPDGDDERDRRTEAVIERVDQVVQHARSLSRDRWENEGQ